MRRDAPASSDCGTGWSQKLSGIESRAWIRTVARHAFVVGVLSGLGAQSLSASANEVPSGLTVQRSMRAAPHRLIVHPSDATVAADQTQRFSVTDAQGKPVAVRWNVSGIGCSGSACGSINEQGVYQPPSTLPQPRMVTVEGVLVSDPNYSVLTEVRLEAALTAPASAESAQIYARKTQPPAAPQIEKRPVSARVESPPPPNAVAAAPELGRQNVARVGKLPALPGAVAAAPGIGNRSVSGSGGSLPLPSAVAAAPGIGNRSVSGGGGSLPLPNAIASAPVVESPRVARSGELSPMPGVVAPRPPVEKTNVSSGGAMSTRVAMSTPPKVIAAAPAVENRSVARNAPLPPLSNTGRAAPENRKSNTVLSLNVQSLQPIASVTPTHAPIPTVKPQPSTSAVVGIQNPVVNAALPPMQDLVAVPPTAAAGNGGAISMHNSSVVTYANGQLTINAENLTLAALLKLIAEKTGAVIDLPPGTGHERIFEHAGPGKPNDVLTQLLNGSHFNFVIVNSPQDPNAVAQVLLTVEQEGASPAAAPRTEVLAARAQEPAPSPYPAKKPAEEDTTQPLPPPVDVKPPAEDMSPDQRGEYMKQLFKKLSTQSEGSQTPPPAPPQ